MAPRCIEDFLDANLDDRSAPANRADQLRIRRLEVMGCRIRTATLPGDRARPPLLMLNGMGAPLEILIPLAESLDGIEVVLFDIPGIGESSMPQIPYTLPQLASATGRILTQLA